MFMSQLRRRKLSSRTNKNIKAIKRPLNSQLFVVAYNVFELHKVIYLSLLIIGVLVNIAVNNVLFAIVTSIVRTTVLYFLGIKYTRYKDNNVQKVISIKRQKGCLVEDGSYPSAECKLRYQKGILTTLEIYLPAGVVANDVAQSLIDSLRETFIKDKRKETLCLTSADSVNGVVVFEVVDAAPTYCTLKAKYFKKVPWNYFLLGETYPKDTRLPKNILKLKDKGKEKSIVYYDVMSTPMSIGCGVTGGGKSVLQRNIMLGCLLRPEKWLLMAIDIKRVELGPLKKYGVMVGVTTESALEVLTFAVEIMSQRYEKMEGKVVKYTDLPPEEQGPAIMVMVDEGAELLLKGSNKDENAMKDAVRELLESIYRLGRAACVFATIWAQRPDRDAISMQIRQNAAVRIGCGRLPSTISTMVFENSFGTTIDGSIVGRAGIQILNQRGIEFQAYYQDPHYLDKYLKKHHLPTEIYSNTQKAPTAVKDDKQLEIFKE